MKNRQQKKLNWSEVFNYNHKWVEWRDRDEVREAAKAAGYKFFTFNNVVWDTNTDKEIGITVDELF